MNILVTGGMGFIGHNVSALLEKSNYRVIIADNRTDYGIIPKDELDYIMSERLKKVTTPHNYVIDICSNKIETLFQTYKPDMVIHLASFPRQKVVNANPTQGSKVMSEGLLNLLELSKKHNVSKFVYISSSMVYGDFKDYVTEDATCNPQGQYGILKLAGEWLVKDYARRNCFNYTIIRPSAVYGPMDVEDRVISKFLLAAMRNETVLVNGSDEMLDFTYVDDVAKGIVAASLSENTNNKTYNITRGYSRSLLYAAKIATQLSNKGELKIKERDMNFPKRGALSVEEAYKDFGYSPKVNVEEGLKDYYEWLANSTFWSRSSV